MASVLNSAQKNEFDQKGFIIIRNFFDEEETILLQQASYKDKNIKKHLYDRKDSEGLVTKMVAWNHPDDSIYGTKKIFNSNLREVYNLGSSEQVSINQMIEMVEKISNYKVEKQYLLDKPKGVRGRSSDNTKISKDLGWLPKMKLREGLELTYNWIYESMTSGDNSINDEECLSMF